jgi:predicted dehydrogenase
MLKAGVVGYGYWGPNLVRNFNQNPGFDLRYVIDKQEDKLAKVRATYPAIKTDKDPDILINDPEIDAVVIATPTNHHFPLAMKALQAGKHVFVEKPLASTSQQAQQLVDEAQKRELTLLVDHTFVYTPAVRKIKSLMSSGELGDLLYFDSTRINLGLFQHDVDVMWDLAVHDLSILSYIFPEKPVAVSASGMSHVKGQPQNTAFITLFFTGSTIAHINVNWLSPVKIRQTLIAGSRKMVVYDDMEPTEKIKIYDRGVHLAEHPDDIQKMRVGYRTGDMLAPQLETSEALQAAVAHFADCILNKRLPDTHGQLGVDVVQILEAAQQSMRLNGQSVTL